MLKQDIVKSVAAASNLTEAQARAAVDATIAAIQDALSAGDEVMISGFGSFRVVERPPRRGRNPRSGDRMMIGPSRCPAFRAGVRLKGAVNGEPVGAPNARDLAYAD